MYENSLNSSPVIICGCMHELTSLIYDKGSVRASHWKILEGTHNLIIKSGIMKKVDLICYKCLLATKNKIQAYNLSCQYTQ